MRTDRSFEFRLDDTWVRRTGRGVGVAIIDSGVDGSHRDLKGRVASSVEPRTEGGRTVFLPGPAADAAGHGTACAGIISRIAPDAELHSIRVLGSGGVGDGHSFLAGLEHAIDKRHRVINLSLGTTRPQFFAPLHDLLDRAYQAGCIVVAAANNLPQPSFPSAFSSSVIAVSKSAQTDPFVFGFRFGEVIELTAPGIGVRVPWPDGGYRTVTGNSFACPQIAGIVALMLEADPDLTPFQVKALLHSFAIDRG